MKNPEIKLTKKGNKSYKATSADLAAKLALVPAWVMWCCEQWARARAALHL